MVNAMYINDDVKAPRILFFKLYSYFPTLMIYFIPSDSVTGLTHEARGHVCWFLSHS